ncbi:MAG: hypothetical protein IJ499_03250 [Clostridia bacterium]|nr:hypothetical protein [Clostridia bacterium]
MANKTIDALVYCPFYICEGKTTITCEGIIGDKTVSQFKNENDKKYHENNFCIGKTCHGCGLYLSLMSGYQAADSVRTAVLPC